MTIIEDRIIRNGATLKVTPARNNGRPPTVKPPPVPKPPVPTLVRVTRRAAVAITAGIAVTSFLLSFAGLCNLAQRSGIPDWLAWLWPLTVDGTILQATVGIVTLTAYANQDRNRRFFWAVLVAAASVSVGGNILHALIIGPLPPILTATVAAIAPLSLLATTHGMAILTRFDPESER